MPLDPSYVGRSVSSPESYEVTRTKIREFADAIGDPNPLYRDPEAAKASGHADVVAPPTFPIVFCFAASQQLLDELGIALHRVVHGEQRFSYTRPVRAGDRLACTVTVEKIRTVAGNDFLTTRTDVASDTGEPVLTAWSTLVVRGDAEEAE